MSRPVIIAAGGTGGHVIPALAVADELQSQSIPVVWLGTQSGLEARLVPAAGLPIHWITIAGLRGKSVMQTLVAPWYLLRACWQSIAIMRSLKPRAVLGMGGFVSGPAGIASLVLRKPLVLHEQNAVAGLTNRYLSRFATVVFSAWPNVFSAVRRVNVVGNPVGRDFSEKSTAARTINPNSAIPLKILVVGGSRGARALNEVVPQALALLNKSVSVVHQAGSIDGDLVRERYASASLVDSEVCDFIDDMYSAYSRADIVISRSGAMTVTELSALGIPSILVPFPYAVDDHQTKNAEQLSATGAAWLVPQDSLTAESLAALLRPLLDNRQVLHAMSQAAKTCFIPHAAEAVAASLIKVSR